MPTAAIGLRANRVTLTSTTVSLPGQISNRNAPVANSPSSSP